MIFMIKYPKIIVDFPTLLTYTLFAQVLLKFVKSFIEMWGFLSSAAGKADSKKVCAKSSTAHLDCSDDEISSCASKEEGLECPICWESFNIVENVPHVLWCGHTLCKNCILSLHWAVVKLPTVPIELPLLVSCPWCNILSPRILYNGNLMFPRKNYFLLWMVESRNDDQPGSQSLTHRGHGTVWSNGNMLWGNHANHQDTSLHRALCTRLEHSNHNEQALLIRNYSGSQMIHVSLLKSLAFFIQLTTKFPLLVIFLLIVLYAIPASAAVLAIYALIAILFALPSTLILYFAYPWLDWLIREIFS